MWSVSGVVLARRHVVFNTVAFLLKAKTVDPEKQPLTGNDCVTCNNGVIVGSSVFCAVCAEAI
jgi:hypothetical protein